ncbi:MAG: hypothetical protein ACREDR_02850 [Blastocatellia bacterium]
MKNKSIFAALLFVLILPFAINTGRAPNSSTSFMTVFADDAGSHNSEGNTANPTPTPASGLRYSPAQPTKATNPYSQPTPSAPRGSGFLEGALTLAAAFLAWLRLR